VAVDAVDPSVVVVLGYQELDWMTEQTHFQLLVSHYERVWRRKVARRLRLPRGPLHELPTDFCVEEFGPCVWREMWTYASVCMSQPTETKGIELHLHSRSQSDSIVELLTVVAHYHRTSARVGLGDSVNFGRPWLEGSNCTHGLVSLPYLDGPLLENCFAGNDVVKCYWLIPITAQEVAYKKQHGLEALEREFERVGFDYLDPLRDSVVQ
jgi:suppressor of fused protein SUFU